MAGKSLDDFFSKYVRGEAEIDYNGIVARIGLQLKADEANTQKAYIGANLVDDNGRLAVRSVPAGTPAYEQGLNYRRPDRRRRRLPCHARTSWKSTSASANRATRCG